MGDYTPVETGDQLPYTKTAGAVITGGQLLQVTGDNALSPCTANTQRAVGIAAHDAPSGGRVSVWPIPGCLHESINNNAGTITAGLPITAGATGGVDTASLASTAAAGTLIGLAAVGGATTAKVRWRGI